MSRTMTDSAGTEYHRGDVVDAAMEYLTSGAWTTKQLASKIVELLEDDDDGLLEIVEDGSLGGGVFDPDLFDGVDPVDRGYQATVIDGVVVTQSRHVDAADSRCEHGMFRSGAGGCPMCSNLEVFG